MRIKGYKLFLESHQTGKSVRRICKEYGIKNWSINSEGLLDVDGDVDLSFSDLIKLPLRFGKVSGYFNCSNNALTSLEGCPKEVVGNFDCYNNALTSLKDCSEEVGGDFDCSHNKLTSLKGCPEKVGGYFDCSHNKLTSLKGCPEKVIGDFYCYDNKLTNLIGGPQIVLGEYIVNNNQINSFEGFPDDYEGYIDFDNNPVKKILNGFPYDLFVKAIHLINDYDAIWNGEVVPERMEMVKEKLGLL